MDITEHLHRLRMDFRVTPDTERFVYLYVILGARVHLIDAGVDGADAVVGNYLATRGRDISEVASILLTHAHPDHVGGAAAIRDRSGCTVYASAPDQPWIEDIDQQFAERPIPNFHTLLNRSVPVGHVVADHDILTLEDGVTLRVIDTPGHSAGSVSYLWIEQGTVFTGDAVPVPGDIPIFVSAADSIASLERLAALDEADQYLSAWDDVQGRVAGQDRIRGALDLIAKIRDAVASVLAAAPEAAEDQTYADVCAALHLEHLLGNPLFAASVHATLRELAA